ncbi:MAG: Gfo/Idh/MocA family protein [Gammaproteobacteria bacterium]
MNQINIAIIGVGDWGKNLIRNFNQFASIVAVCDLNPVIADTVARQYQVISMTFQQILASKEIDAVVISTNRSHYNLVKQALYANKHVFVEKPLANNLQQAKDLYKISKQVNKKLMVGHLLHYHPAFIELKKICYSKVLGDISYVYSNRLTFGKFMPEEDVILNLASYDISMILSLLGKPKSLTAFADSFLIKNVVDQAILRFNFSEQQHGHVFVSWFHPVQEHKLVVIGSKAMAVFDDLAEWPKKLCLYHHVIDLQGDIAVLKNLHPEFVKIYNPVEPLFNETKHFIECIQKDLIPQTSAEESLDILDIIDQASRQLKSLQKKSTFIGNI